ncbi:MAG: family 16 glycoside hydrolase [Gemmatimonadota bacterium]
MPPLLAVVPCADAAAQSDDRGAGLYAEIHTTKGPIVARLEPELTPLAVAGFVGLAEGTIENDAFQRGRPFYDGTVFHRVVPGHVIQAGAPASDRADGPGYTFPNEIHAAPSHDHAGALGVANAGPHTNGSQFYITLGDRSYLDGDYIVFGDVVEGMDVVRSIEQDDVVDSVRIARVGERAESFRPDTESFRAMVQAAERRVAELDERKRAAEREWVARHWPDAVGPEDSVRIVVERPGTAGGPADGPRRVRYRGTAVRWIGHLLGHDGAEFEPFSFASGEDGAPTFVESPRAFPFTPGETSINPGLDAVVADMAPGERRVAIVPSALGYGRGGYYSPPVPDEPRLVISPHTLLVYEVDVLPAAGETARDTPRWSQHDPERPAPPVVEPGPASTTLPAPAPADAIVLLDGDGDLTEWESADGGPAGWTGGNGYVEVRPGSGAIRTRRAFGDIQLHIEWMSPDPPRGDGQDRGNSGVFLMGRYEIQILDSYGNRTYADGQAGAIYGQYPPLVNASRAPGEWQSYDIIFRRPRFDEDGELVRPAIVTAFHNGVLIHDRVELRGPVGHHRQPPYEAHPDRLPLQLQDHGHPVRFRNIWVRELEPGSSSADADTDGTDAR